MGRALLDAAMAWEQRRIQERRRRAKLDPRGWFSASRHPVARALRGSSTARRGDGLGTSANPGTRASGEARPTEGVLSPEASSGERPSWVEQQLDAAMAWAQQRIQERGRRAELEPRGVFSAPRHPVARALRGSSTARRCDGLGTAANPGTQASGGARPTGVVLSPEASSGKGPSWVEHRSTLRWLGHSSESRNAGVGRSPTPGGCSQPRGIQWQGPFVGRASLDAAMAWAQQRIQERGRRAEPDPRRVFSAPRHPVASALRGSSNSSTRRWLGHSSESRNAGVERSSTHGGDCQHRGIQSRGPFVGRASLDAAMAGA